jgi:hypothetical protein
MKAHPPQGPGAVADSCGDTWLADLGKLPTRIDGRLGGCRRLSKANEVPIGVPSERANDATIL